MSDIQRSKTLISTPYPKRERNILMTIDMHNFKRGKHHISIAFVRKVHSYGSNKLL